MPKKSSQPIRPRQKNALFITKTAAYGPKEKWLVSCPLVYWEWFRKKGSIMRSGNFKKGKQVGKWTTYDKTGEVVKVTNFDKK